MKRWTLRILLLLIVGAIVNVAVAWGMAISAQMEIHAQEARAAQPRAKLRPLRFAVEAGSTLPLLSDYAPCAENGWPFPALSQQQFLLDRRWSSELRAGRRPIRLPVDFLVLGFAINTVLYAAVLFVLFFGFQHSRRIIRLRRGRCPKCAYDLRGTPGSSESSGSSGGGGCPECGWGRFRGYDQMDRVGSAQPIGLSVLR